MSPSMRAAPTARALAVCRWLYERDTENVTKHLAARICAAHPLPVE